MENKSLIQRASIFIGVIFFIANLLVGCSSAKVSVEILRPPIIPLSGPVSNVAIINRVDNAQSTTKHYRNGVLIGEYNGMTKILVNEAITEMSTTFNANFYFTSFDTSLIYIPKTRGIITRTMTSDVTNRVCAQLGVDAIVAVERYDAEVSTDSDVNYSMPVDRNYGTVRIPYFNGEQSVYMKMLFRTYLCNDSVSSVDNEATLSTQAAASATGSTTYEVDSKMADAGNVLVMAARELGKDYASQVAPYWESQSRKIYNKGNDQLQEAYALVTSGLWTEATDIWYLLATSNNKKIASRATYNLIVASEVAGDMKLAEEWANLCVTKYNMQQGADYLLVLKKRNEEIIMIRRLFPSM